MSTTKTCTKCGETKPLDGFHKAKGGRYGVNSKCKPCVAENHRRYREKNRDKIAEQHRHYWKENRDKLAEKRRRYYEANRDKILERSRHYYEENRNKLLEYQHRYFNENRDVVNATTSKNARTKQALTEAFATVPKNAPWTPDEESFLLANNGMTTYEKAVQLGRTYDACAGKLTRLRKKLTA